MIDLATPEVWLVCGSQHLYGPGPLQQVAAHGREIAGAFAGSPKLPLKTEFKALLTTPDEIAKLCLDANSDPNCAGLILWMHTFSPSKMWVRGLNSLKKPFVHLHTQFNRDLPWDFDRHGLHEPEPVGARRPGGGLHPHPHASGAQSRRRPLDRSGGAGSHRRLDARGARLARLAGGQILPFRRQHAPGGGDRGRQGCDRNEIRLCDQRLRRRRSRGRGERRLRREGQGFGQRIRENICRRSGTAQSRRPARIAALWRAARIGLARLSRTGRLQGLHHDVRGLARPAATSGPRAATPDGRGLWLRGRGRLEDRRSGARNESHGRRHAGRHVVHGGLHLSSGAGRASGSRRPHARNLRDPSPQASPGSRSIRFRSAARRIRFDWYSMRRRARRSTRA